jgi:hypothetical protein
MKDESDPAWVPTRFASRNPSGLSTLCRTGPDHRALRVCQAEDHEASATGGTGEHRVGPMELLGRNARTLDRRHASLGRIRRRRLCLLHTDCAA